MNGTKLSNFFENLLFLRSVIKFRLNPFREISRNWKKNSSSFVFRETGETLFRGNATQGNHFENPGTNLQRFQSIL